MSVTLTLADDIDISRGDMIVPEIISRREVKQSSDNLLDEPAPAAAEWEICIKTYDP